jgi:hypothetical protein
MFGNVLCAIGHEKYCIQIMGPLWSASLTAYVWNVPQPLSLLMLSQAPPHTKKDDEAQQDQIIPMKKKSTIFLLNTRIPIPQRKSLMSQRAQVS